jgi:hypothetical protein
MMNLNPAQLGLIRGLLYPVLVLVLTYFSTAEHLASLGVSASAAVVIAGFLSSLEHFVAADSGKALFGAARSR